MDETHMGRKYYLLATEGPHDQAMINKLFEFSGLEKFNGIKKNLDTFWYELLPIYPVRRKNGEEDIYTRLIIPSFFTSPTHSIAVYWGEGSNLIPNLIAIAHNYEKYVKDIQAFGLIVDADRDEPKQVASSKAKALQSIFPSISEEPGVITPGMPDTAIYVLPDNKRKGVLDTLLIECAAVVYSDHRKGAEKFIAELDEQHTRHLQKPHLKEKAIVACIASILKPGATNTASIAQNNWISSETLTKVVDVASLYAFLKNLLKLS